MIRPGRLGRVLLLLASALSIRPAAAQDASIAPLVHTIRFASEGANPPFTQVDANGVLQGFEVDVARALCEVLKATCTFAVQDWESLIPDLRAGRVDAIVSSLEITEERRQRIAFTRPFYRTPAAFMAPKDGDWPDLSPVGLKGKRIGAVEGSVYEAYLQDHQPEGGEILRYGSQDEANLDLALGRIDLVLGNKFALADWLKRGREADCCRLVGDAPRDVEAFGEGFGIGLRRHDTVLREALDDAIAAIQSDGTYERIRAGYVPFDIR